MEKIHNKWGYLRENKEAAKKIRLRLRNGPLSIWGGRILGSYSCLFGHFRKNTSAFLCPFSLHRMAKEFIKSPTQLKVNLDYLKFIASAGPKETILSGIDLLEDQTQSVNREHTIRSQVPSDDN